MRKSITSALLILALVLCLVGGAQATPVTFQLAGLANPTLTASVTADYNAATGVATFNIQNTSSQGTITGFAFNLPGNGAGVSTVSYLGGGGWHLLNSPVVIPDTINTPMQLGFFDVGLGTGVSFNGGKVADGIDAHTAMTFALQFTGSAISSLSTGSILAALTSPGGTSFAARFQGIGPCDASDVAAPTPLPAAVWLLGSGMLGLAGLRRRRTA